jgi:hypothetical protein
VYKEFAGFVPFGVVTKTLAFPVVPAGVLAVMVVALTTITLVAATPPIVTEVAPVNLNPDIVIDLLPAIEPLVGLTDVTKGAVVQSPPVIVGAGDAPLETDQVARSELL